jgi:hypothetical protein
MRSISAFMAALVLLLAVGLYLCYSEVKNLRDKAVAAAVKQERLEREVTVLEQTVEFEAGRTDTISRVTVDLGKENAAQQKEFRQFTRQIDSLARDNAEIRSVLRVRIPPAALYGLRSFGRAGAPGDSHGESP